ncbi:MAG TPA: outer membrane protein assembly factor BamB [Paucimonas sp.]|nr:outer membrane protein assembly factor BamB [Paucimonas sp.]
MQIARTAARLACAGILIALGGCSTLSSLNPFAKAPKNAPAALVDFKPTMSVRTAWTASVGNSDEFVFSPALAGDSLYAASANGTIMRINPASGQQVWRTAADMRLTAGVGSDGNTVVVAGEKGVILAFDGNGKLRWKAQASSEILSSPAVGQGVVIVRSVDNRITAYDAESGNRRWFVQRSAPALTLRNAPGITIAGPAAFVALPGGKLVALALNNGAPLWEAAVSDPRGATELERIADTAGSPVVLGREVCAASYQGKVACFDASNGAPRWSKELSSDVGVAVDERFVFAADEHGVVTAFTRDSGASMWRNNKLANRRLSAPVSFGRAVAVGDRQGYVHFLSREDGAFLARVATDGSAIVAAPVVTGSGIVFQTKAGQVVALTTE